MTTIDPTDSDAEEELEEALLEKKRSESKYGDQIEGNGDD